MPDLINQLGIDWRLLLAQVVNFLILLWVLKRFAFEPLKTFLRQRQKRIEKGLEDAEYASQQREKLRTLGARIVAEGQKEAEGILQEARQRGVKEHDQLLSQARDKAESVFEQAKLDIEREKDNAIREARSELGAIVMQATEKVLREKVDEERDRALIEKALREIK